MSTRIVCFLTVCSFVVATARAGEPAKLPTVVAAGLKEVAEQCSGAGGRPVTKDAVKRVDLNGDGHEEFVLFTGWIHCENAASVYGDRQKGLKVYAADGQGGAAVTYEDWVYDAKVEGSGRDAKLWLTTSAEGCGRQPAADFASESFCDRSIVWNAAAKKFTYAPVSTVRMIE
jgi:hypothetical protein